LAGAAPTLSDDVIFDSASNATAYAVTIGTNAVAQDITIAGPLVGNVTITSAATSVINCYGSWLSAATGVVFTTTSGAAINFLATTTGKTVTTNNVTLGAMGIVFSNSSGGWTLGSAFTCTGIFTVTSGTFNTGTNYAINAASYSSGGGTFKSITLNSSTLTFTATGGFQILTTATNLTFSGASSTIVCSNGSPTFGGISGLTYGTVQFTSATLVTVTISGANTYTTLTFTSRTTDGIGAIGFSGNQTVTGTLTVGTANTAVRRLWLRSSAVGTQRTFTVAVVATLADVDFRDIVAAGAAGTLSGTRLGNCRNNSNITFGAGATKYWSTVNGVSANWSGTSWATSTGGVPAINNFPLAQDTCIVDDSGATVGNGLRTGNTITIDANWNIGTLNLSGRTLAFNWTQANLDPFFYGDVTLTTAMTMVTVTGSPSWTFCGQGAIQTLNSAGLIIRLNQLIVDSPGWGLTLAVNTEVDLSPIVLPFNNGAFILTAGTLDFANKNLSAPVFSIGAGANTLVFGSTGTLTSTVTVAAISFTGSTTTTVSGTPLVIVNANTSATRTITPGVVTEDNSISFRVSAGTGILTLTTGAYRNLDFTDGVNPTGYAGAMANASPTIYGNFKASTNMTKTAGTGVFTFAGAVAGTRTITTASVVFDNPFTFNSTAATPTNVIFQLQDNLIAGPSPAGVDSTRLTTLTAGTLDLNNFTLTTGFLSSTASTVRSLAFGASGKMVITGSGTTVCTTNTATGLTVTGSKRIELSYNGSVGIRSISGPLIATTIEGTNLLDYFVTAGSDTVTFNGARTYGTIDFSNAGAGTFTGTFTNGSINIYGNLTLKTAMTLGSGTSNVEFASTTGTKTITTAGQTFNFPIYFNGVGGAWAMQDVLTMPSQILTLSNGTLQLKSGTTNTVGTFVATSATVKSLQATTPGSQATISQASGTVNAINISIQDSNATGGAVWNASNTLGNVNLGNNTGWRFSIALSSVSGTGVVGTVRSNIVPTALTGVRATGAVGDLYPGWYLIPTTQNPAWANIIQS
jgi:hypothetical protein